MRKVRKGERGGRDEKTRQSHLRFYTFRVGLTQPFGRIRPTRSGTRAVSFNAVLPCPPHCNALDVIKWQNVYDVSTVFLEKLAESDRDELLFLYAVFSRRNRFPSLQTALGSCTWHGLPF